MRYLLLVILIFFSNLSKSQLEIPNRPKVNLGSPGLPSGGVIKSDGKLLPPDSNPYPTKYTSSKTSLDKTQSEKKIEREINPNSLNMNTNKNKDYYKIFRRDQYLGDATTNSGKVRITCRDHEYVDGDKIRVYLNKKTVISELTLKGEPFIFEVKLEDGFNTIDFEALNEGLSPPNTAELKVYDENGALLFSEQWNIAKGYKATASIVRMTSAQ